MIDQVLDYYVNNYSAESTLSLLQTLSHPSQGGLGYKLQTFNPYIDLDGWEVDHTSKTIKLDTSSLFSNYTIQDIAINLKEAIETDITKQRSSMISRIGWGTGKVVVGVIETVVGTIGIIVPEPGTTLAGVGMVTLGVNSLTDGVTQLSGANQGHGYNLLGSAFGKVGSVSAELAGYDSVVGDKIGRGVFMVSSLAFGSIGTVKILNVKSLSAIRFGVAGQPGGVEVGRIAMAYPSNRAMDGMTIINISNNSGQFILRFVTHNGKLVVNGRIVGVSKILKHEGNWKVVVKGLLKLLSHGAKQGM